MKVILTKPVPTLGNPGDVVDVAPGYGRNFLIAKGMGREATTEALAQLAAVESKRFRKRKDEEGRRQKIRNVLDGVSILVRATANEEGHLFGGVGPKEIAAAIEKRKKIIVDPKRLAMPHHLKILGEHRVMLELGGGQVASFNVVIKPPE